MQPTLLLRACILRLTLVSKDDEFVVVNGKRHRKKMTSGWFFNIPWKDGTTTWDPLKHLKETNPVDIAGYVVENKIASELAFS
jgi:hypothetical protein